jgi:hypothetical protein
MGETHYPQLFVAGLLCFHAHSYAHHYVLGYVFALLIRVVMSYIVTFSLPTRTSQKLGLNSRGRKNQTVPASYKTPTVLLIFTFNSGKRLGSDGGNIYVKFIYHHPASSAYGVYAPQLIRYSIACALNSDVLYRTQPLTQKLIKQGCAANRS